MNVMKIKCNYAEAIEDYRNLQDEKAKYKELYDRDMDDKLECRRQAFIKKKLIVQLAEHLVENYLNVPVNVGSQSYKMEKSYITFHLQ